MAKTETTDTHTQRIEARRNRLALIVGVLAGVVFLAVLALGYTYGRMKLLGVVIFAFVAMGVGVVLHKLGRFSTPLGQLWGRGLASGAMLASAAALLAPKAIVQHPEYGGFAIALGYLLGFAGHEFGHLLSHRQLPINATVSELSLHGLMAGSIMGVVYGTIPSLSPLFGYGIVAHKLPAGFSGTEALEKDGLSTAVMVLPAAIVGIAAIPLSIATPDLGPVVKAIFYGISTGIFAHVALDMIPECTGGGSGHGHGHGHDTVTCEPDADRQRRHAVGSTVIGAALIFLLWQALIML